MGGPAKVEETRCEARFLQAWPAQATERATVQRLHQVDGGTWTPESRQRDINDVPSLSRKVVCPLQTKGGL